MSREKSYYERSFLEKQLKYYSSLPEKQKRHFLAMEYERLGWGSKRYLSRVFECDRQTINKGLSELTASGFKPDYSRQRKAGGGRKKKEWSVPPLTKWILAHVEAHTAGNPTNDATWTHLRPKDIALHLKTVHKTHASHTCIRRILAANGYRKRKPPKTIEGGKSPDRHQQFEILFFLVALFMDMDNNPILSIDTKKKEPLGELTRNEAVLSKDGNVPAVNDHDFAHLATGKAIPHGIYDLKQNKGYITLGNSHETAPFVLDNLDWWWQNYGQHQYENASTILILCDSGGANGHRHHLFKKSLQIWARKIGKRIVVAHYPPYCSKYNPIERKLFAHVHRTIQNTILTDLPQVKELMEKTSTQQGLSVEVRINEAFYPTGIKCTAEAICQKRILRHPTLPKLSYTILP
jgi:hypothetical protein